MPWGCHLEVLGLGTVGFLAMKHDASELLQAQEGSIQWRPRHFLGKITEKCHENLTHF